MDIQLPPKSVARSLLDLFLDYSFAEPYNRRYYLNDEQKGEMVDKLMTVMQEHDIRESWARQFPCQKWKGDYSVACSSYIERYMRKESRLYSYSLSALFLILAGDEARKHLVTPWLNLRSRNKHLPFAQLDGYRRRFQLCAKLQAIPWLPAQQVGQEFAHFITKALLDGTGLTTLSLEKPVQTAAPQTIVQQQSSSQQELVPKKRKRTVEPVIGLT